VSETIRCARCDKRLAIEDAERLFVPDPDEPWKQWADIDEPGVYLLVCARCGWEETHRYA
jgi:hypothetical protein